MVDMLRLRMSVRRRNRLLGAVRLRQEFVQRIFESGSHLLEPLFGGFRDVCDGCPSDSNKIEPGTCGCVQDGAADSDDDGVPDCEHLCHGADDAVLGDCTGAIPTVSVWGLLILALLLLVGSKVVFGKQSRLDPFP